MSTIDDAKTLVFGDVHVGDNRIVQGTQVMTVYEMSADGSAHGMPALELRLTEVVEPIAAAVDEVLLSFITHNSASTEARAESRPRRVGQAYKS